MSASISSCRRAATGAISYFGSGPLGRPRWEQTVIAAAPRSASSSRVGSAARMRESSATFPSSSGTLRSARTRTRLPATSASRTDLGRFTLRGDFRGKRRPDHRDQVDEPAAVAPLVVVPPEDLRHPALGHRELAVVNAAVRRLLDVA